MYNCRKGLSERTPLRSAIDKQDVIELKCFCTAKETIGSVKTHGMKIIFSSYTSDQRLISKIYKYHSQNKKNIFSKYRPRTSIESSQKKNKNQLINVSKNVHCP